MNLISQFLDTASERDGVTAVVQGDGRRISYSALAARSAALAADWRESGIGKGDRVLVAVPVGVELYASIAALWRLGAVIVFPEPAMGLSGLKHAVAMTAPRAVLTGGWFKALPLLVPALWGIPVRLGLGAASRDADLMEDVASDHPALISFTSGSTGAPKGIVRSHGFLAAQNACVATMLRSDNAYETDLVAFPVFVIANLGMGATSVLPDWKLTRHDRADPAAIGRQIQREAVTRGLLPPVICERLADSGVDPGLKMIFTGGGPIFPDLMTNMIATMPETSVMAVYGSTEAEPIAHQMIGDIEAHQWQAMQRGSGLIAGRPVPETQVKIVDDEILVTGDHVNKSYLGGQGDTENKVRIDGEIWHRTGDAGALGEDGTLWLRGRHSARAGGVYPFEVEVAARQWAGVRRVALVPGNDPARLAVEGVEPSAGVWQAEADKLGDIRVTGLKEIPLDRRHRSKIDYARLQRLVD